MLRTVREFLENSELWLRITRSKINTFLISLSSSGSKAGQSPYPDRTLIGMVNVLFYPEETKRRTRHDYDIALKLTPYYNTVTRNSPALDEVFLISPLADC